jgi:ribosomal protein L37AE/L43A
LSPPKVGVSRDLIDRFGAVVVATISRCPPRYVERVWRESDSCPICGETTAGADRLAASLFPTLASGFRYGVGIWVHRTCFETCDDTAEPAPIPW